MDPVPAGWWHGGDALHRFLVDLIGAEAKCLRPGGVLPPGPWPPGTRLDEAGLGFDSLERLQLGAAVCEALHLHETGLEDYLLVRSGLDDWCTLAAEALRRFSATLTFRTSGSTGVPRSCPHPLAELEREADALAALLGAPPVGEGRVLAAVPCHHIYGFLFTVLLPRRLGGLPVLDLRQHAPGAVPGLARRGDVVVGHPAFWTAAARAAPSWPPGVTGVTSTAPCPADTATALRLAGLERLLQIHGSSETAGLGWRDDPDAPYTLLPHWQRGDGNGVLRLPACGGLPIAAAVPDRLEWLDRRRYRVRGRQDGAVQVGGTNVFPERVRKVLREHADVADAAVRMMHPSEGMRLKAFIVPRDEVADADALRLSLDAFAARHLSVPERPRAYSFGPLMPIGPMGKVADWQLPPSS